MNDYQTMTEHDRLRLDILECTPRKELGDFDKVRLAELRLQRRYEERAAGEDHA